MLERTRIKFACGHYYPTIFFVKHQEDWDAALAMIQTKECNSCFMAREYRRKRKEAEYDSILSNISLPEM